MPDDDEDRERLPPAHPSFAAHFTHQLYDPDDYQNDELPPFGSDEGSDEIHSWAERLDELRRNPTLRSMLGAGADAQIAQLRVTRQIDADDMVIGQGFTLLRFTGQIDPESREWLTEALSRQHRHTGLDEYAKLRTDLMSFRDESSGSSRDAGVNRWFVVKSRSGDRRLERWFRALEDALAADPIWLDWWATSGEPGRIDFYPNLDSDKNYVQLQRSSETPEILKAKAGLARLGKIVWGEAIRSGKEVDAEGLTSRSRSIVTLPGAPQLLDQLIYSVTVHVGSQLGMPSPPPELPARP